MRSIREKLAIERGWSGSGESMTTDDLSQGQDQHWYKVGNYARSKKVSIRTDARN